jgi:hypothetical protein
MASERPLWDFFRLFPTRVIDSFEVSISSGRQLEAQFNARNPSRGQYALPLTERNKIPLKTQVDEASDFSDDTSGV